MDAVWQTREMPFIYCPLTGRIAVCSDYLMLVSIDCICMEDKIVCRLGISGFSRGKFCVAVY